MGSKASCWAGNNRWLDELVYYKYLGGIILIQYCMVCGRRIEIVEHKSDPFDDDEDELPVKKSVMFCQICEAKIKDESDKKKKEIKPM